MTDAPDREQSYVRTAMLPPQTAPSTQVGAVRWVHENLLSSWLNAILTILSVYFVWTIVSSIYPWLANSVWDATSLTDCRAKMDERLGEGVRAACFAVISDRWQQLVFGFYPQNGYWRPPTALFVFLIAIAPVLFTQLPRKLLWFTMIAPILIFTLLWGGSIWAPISVALGFVIGFIAYRVIGSRFSALLAVLAAIILPILYWFTLSGTVNAALTAIAPKGLPYVESKDFGGFTLSIVIGLTSIMLSLPLGILLALGRQSNLFIINKVSVVFIEVIRGVPLIVWLFTAQLLLNYFLPKGTNFDLMLRVIIMVTLFSSAYIAEVIRGGLAALPKGQYEAADALGLDYWKSMRLIVLPQALRISIPGIVSSFIGLFKDTTLVAFIGMYDPIGLTSSIRASTDWNGVYWELYIFVGLIFFIFCFSMSRYSMYLERKLHRGNR
ncbi:MAG: amino acid ABC transporter permease [Rhodobacterales bacterium]|nr:amino acid ABC transporter permease [Rhodobacterales bacterium]